MNGQDRKTTKTDMTGRAHNHLSSGFAKIEAKKLEERQVKQQAVEMEEPLSEKELIELSTQYLEERGFKIEK